MLRLAIRPLVGIVSVLLLGGCPTSTLQRNPFLGYTEEYGIAGQQQTQQGGAATGTSAVETFRRPLTVSFRNNHTSADLNVSFVAWVETSSIRSAEQQDVLLSSGFAQLTHSVDLGTAFTLPTGTFVYDGGGVAGATALLLGPAQAATSSTSTTTPTEHTITIPTPDAILAFVEPPVSCESIAFYFSRNGEPLTSVPVDGATGPFGGSASTGPFKTMAQIDVYQCSPFKPGVFFSRSGGTRQPNEYLEGEAVTFDFNPTPDANGYFGIVTIAASQTGTTTP